MGANSYTRGMKNYLFASILLTLGLTAVAGAQFADVAPSHPHASAITYVQDQGIVSGYGDGSFRPDNAINRAEFTKIMIESAFSDAAIARCGVGGIGLSDVQASDWFAPYVCVAKQNGVVGGYPDGTFKGGNNVNYAEAAKIVAETFDVGGGTAGNQWYDVYVSALAAASATPRTGIAPTAQVTRGEVAEMIYQVKGTPTPAPTASSNTANVPALPALPAYTEYTPALLADLQAAGVPFVLNFSASWCPNCLALDKKLQANLSQLPPSTLVLQADYDAEGDLRAEYGVTRQTSGVLFAADGTTQTLNGRLSYDAINDFFLQ